MAEGCAAADDGERRIYVHSGVSVSFVFQCHLSACGMIVAGIHLPSRR